jgi:hypothetical protein
MTVLTDHIHTFGRAMQERHGMRLHKIALDAGFTCPNRDAAGVAGLEAHQAARPPISTSFLLVSLFDGLLY